ncbi:hypothetical protein MPTK1_4g12950 [Marchantia polymorpha subsp. ruderalis]|uniref:Uncharacterized protein n=2 Tax=Marchantia polymorpha TaxID=3197 RepID=A0AAF6B9C5_MARPO|nr:hypothetical protein MARPO_0138s0032 [Marchantia polymorpha]BBN08609.1 hypothetical protein Mp_4g12950 [Marchantia polymorpha subsp. ruderalis]|eukprot:PTQ29596.1 hypothetical protein MARPO_0138s0032 [Marchantia polymorpha]
MPKVHGQAESPRPQPRGLSTRSTDPRPSHLAPESECTPARRQVEVPGAGCSSRHRRRLHSHSLCPGGLVWSGLVSDSTHSSIVIGRGTGGAFVPRPSELPQPTKPKPRVGTAVRGSQTLSFKGDWDWNGMGWDGMGLDWIRWGKSQHKQACVIHSSVEHSFDRVMF